MVNSAANVPIGSSKTNLEYDGHVSQEDELSQDDLAPDVIYRSAWLSREAIRQDLHAEQLDLPTHI